MDASDSQLSDILEPDAWGTLKCTLCNKEATKMHLRGQEHSRRLAWLSPSVRARWDELSQETWVQWNDDAWRCLACNRNIDDQHLNSAGHSRKLGVWKWKRSQSTEETSLEFIGLKPWEEGNPDTELWPYCFMCEKWVDASEDHGKETGSKQHTENLRLHYLPRSRWYINKVLPRKHQWSPALCSQMATFQGSCPPCRRGDSSSISTCTGGTVQPPTESSKSEVASHLEHDPLPFMHDNATGLVENHASSASTASDETSSPVSSGCETAAPRKLEFVPHGDGHYVQTWCNIDGFVVHIKDRIAIMTPSSVHAAHAPHFTVVPFPVRMPLPKSAWPIGPCIKAMPEETTFSEPVWFAIPVCEGADKVFRSRGNEGWEEIADATFQSGYAFVRVQHFCLFTAAASPGEKRKASFTAYMNAERRRVKVIVSPYYGHVADCSNCHHEFGKSCKSLLNDGYLASNDGPADLNCTDHCEVHISCGDGDENKCVHAVNFSDLPTSEISDAITIPSDHITVAISLPDGRPKKIRFDGAEGLARPMAKPARANLHLSSIAGMVLTFQVNVNPGKLSESGWPTLHELLTEIMRDAAGITFEATDQPEVSCVKVDGQLWRIESIPVVDNNIPQSIHDALKDAMAKKLGHCKDGKGRNLGMMRFAFVELQGIQAAVSFSNAVSPSSAPLRHSVQDRDSAANSRSSASHVRAGHESSATTHHHLGKGKTLGKRPSGKGMLQSTDSGKGKTKGRDSAKGIVKGGGSKETNRSWGGKPAWMHSTRAESGKGTSSTDNPWSNYTPSDRVDSWADAEGERK